MADQSRHKSMDTLRGYVRDAEIFKHHAGEGLLGSPYRSDRADCWLKVKNPAAPAVTREAEEEWN